MTYYVRRDAPLPDLLRAWRAARGWTQVEAAAALGVSLGAYRDWEQGAKPPAHERMVRKLVAYIEERDFGPGEST